MRQQRADAGGVPWCIQPELTEGCSMNQGEGPGGLCHFCGLTAIRNGPGDYKFMSVALAIKIANEMAEWCPKARIEFAMRGEPLMNPEHLVIFDVFRSRLPKAQMMVTTNGDTIRTSSSAWAQGKRRLQERLELMFRFGLDFVLLDTYYPKERRDALREEAYALKDIQVVDYYDDWAPDGKSPYHNHGRKVQRTVVLMDDLAVRDGEHSSRQVKTHAGANMAKTIPAPLRRNCGRPFREMTIAWNGDVTLCCDDWRKEYIVDNVNETSMRDIWINPRFEAARARLMQKDRDFGPCRECDAPAAPRTGLLPVYAPPTDEQVKLTDATFIPKVQLWKHGRSGHE